MDESTSKPDPELQRVAELLRPLWPGVVLVPTPCDIPGVRLYTGTQGAVSVGVALSGPGGAVTVVIAGSQAVGAKTWESPKGMRRALTDSAKDARAILNDLLLALGLEVADG